jgi:fumarate hydratase class II/aspartate ammonia-lyase
MPAIGYTAAAALAKRSVEEGVLIRELVRRDGGLPADEIPVVLDLHRLTDIGVPGGSHGASAGG